MPLSELDYEVLRWAKDPSRAILVQTQPQPPAFLQIRPEDKVVVGVMCGDGMKFNDIIKHQWGIHQAVCGHSHAHVVGVAGGPLTLAPEQQFRDSDKFRHRFTGPYTATQHDLEEILIGCFAQSTNCVELVGHAPCRLAREAGMNLFQIMRSTVNGARVTAEYLVQQPEVQVISEQLGLPVRVDCYLHAEQLEQFKTRAIDPKQFLLHHDEFQAYVERLRKDGIPNRQAAK